MCFLPTMVTFLRRLMTRPLPPQGLKTAWPPPAAPPPLFGLRGGAGDRPPEYQGLRVAEATRRHFIVSIDLRLGG